jgi:hypothetical protein
MMPQVVSVRVQSGQRRSVRLWIPLLPVLLLLGPLLLVGLLVGLALVRVNPVRGLREMWGVLCAARGLRLDIHDHDNTIHVSVR